MDVKEAAVECLPEVAPQARKKGVPPGYKRTETGVIPEDWVVEFVSQLGEVITGSTPATGNKKYWNGSYPWITPTDIKDGNLIDRSERLITEEGLKVTRKLPANSVLVTCIASIGKNAKLQVVGACNQQINAVVPNDRHDAGFLLYMFDHGKSYLLSNAGITATNIISKKAFKKLIFALPPTVTEQRAIATALSDADALIAALQRLIAKKRAIKQGAMQALLTARQRLPGFTSEWETKTLDQLGTFRKGQGISRAQAQSGSLPCVRYGELYTVHHDYIRVFVSHISAEVAALASKVGHGDILFAGSGETKEEIGKCAAIVDDITAYAGGDIVVFRINQGSALFFGYALNTAQVNRQKASLGQGDAVVHISTRALKRISITIPDPEEQTAIATVLADMDAEIEALEARLAKTRALKAGMMQQLLTGRIRLPLEDAA